MAASLYYDKNVNHSFIKSMSTKLFYSFILHSIHSKLTLLLLYSVPVHELVYQLYI